MTSASPGGPRAQKRRTSLPPVPKVPNLGLWLASAPGDFLQVSGPRGGPDGGGGRDGGRAARRVLVRGQAPGARAAAGHRAAEERATVQAARAGGTVLRRALLGGVRHRGDPLRAAAVLRPGGL